MGSGGVCPRVPLQPVNKNSLDNVLNNDLAKSASTTDTAKSDIENEDQHSKLSKDKEKYIKAMQIFEKGKIVRIRSPFCYAWSNYSNYDKGPF